MGNFDNKNGTGAASTFSEEAVEPVAPTQRVPAVGTGSEDVDPTPDPHASSFATRSSIKPGEGINKSKLMLLGGGLAVAVLFFVFTAIVGKTPKKHVPPKPPGQQASQTETKPPKGSVTPLMETVRIPAPENTGGQLGPADIRRTRASDGAPTSPASLRVAQGPTPAKTIPGASLASVPSFADTQQRWEEPKPYGEAASVTTAGSQTQQQNSLKEASLVFVRSPVQNQATAGRSTSDGDASPLLEMNPGTRIQAKLETQISSAVQAPVVAVVEYTYAIGDRIVVPAGARVYGQLQQADRSGLVSVKFDEIELLDGAREKIDAIGTGLDLGPIRGSVSGTNSGRNFLVRAASGVGSLLAQVVGTNSSAAFSEQDILRQRVAENIGTAGDTEVMNLNANSRVVVSVPADTKIYIVFTKHEEQNASELHRIQSSTP
jgi:hypothetical protein